MADAAAFAVILLLVEVAIWSVTIAIVSGIIANQKHRSVVGWVLLSLIVTPTVLILLALPSRAHGRCGPGADDSRHLPDEL